jgi:hypothetical protein
MSAGGSSVLAVAVLAAFVLAATTISARLRRKQIQRERARQHPAAARAGQAAHPGPSVQFSAQASSTDRDQSADLGKPSVSQVPLSLVGTEELADSIHQASLKSPKIRHVDGPFPKRWADRSRKRTAWAAGGSLGAGSAWGGNGCGGGVNGSDGGGCGGGGCGGGGCGGGG